MTGVATLWVLVFVIIKHQNKVKHVMYCMILRTCHKCTAMLCNMILQHSDILTERLPVILSFLYLFLYFCEFADFILAMHCKLFVFIAFITNISEVEDLVDDSNICEPRWLT